MSIRQDERQKMIYQEEPVTGVVGAVEILLCAIGANVLLQHEDMEIRSIADFGESLAKTRLKHWAGQYDHLDPTEIQQELADHVTRIAGYLAGELDRPDEALDDIRMALIWLDRRARNAGVAGPGWYREIVRETTLGR